MSETRAIPLASDRNPVTGRQAMVCDETESVWLYLTDVDGRELIADCWLFNTISAPDNLSGFANSGRPSPAIARFAAADARRGLPAASEMSIAWSPDGHDACVLMAGVPIGFIDSRHRRGFSRHLLAEGPWGQPFDEPTYKALFE